MLGEPDTIDSPPNEPDGTVHKTTLEAAAQAMSSTGEMTECRCLRLNRRMRKERRWAAGGSVTGKEADARERAQ